MQHELEPTEPEHDAAKTAKKILDAVSDSFSPDRVFRGAVCTDDSALLKLLSGKPAEFLRAVAEEYNSLPEKERGSASLSERLRQECTGLKEENGFGFALMMLVAGGGRAQEAAAIEVHDAILEGDALGLLLVLHRLSPTEQASLRAAYAARYWPEDLCSDLYDHVRGDHAPVLLGTASPRSLPRWKAIGRRNSVQIVDTEQERFFAPNQCTHASFDRF